MLVNFCLILSLGVSVYGGTAKDFKDQHCTDPRTMQKHTAYTEWADAYSCTRHRCQPGGRNLAIYTVGCKRVEAPESAIECEEVVEDTNMQFPFCCTRLRCLVVVRGEVWTRVLGQPWETLPAAPWSHMYKMKRPPPTEFSSKSPAEGPVYELGEDNNSPASTNLRSKNDKDCDDTALQRAAGDGAPDIVIALETNNDRLLAEKHKRMRTKETEHRYFEEVQPEPQKKEQLQEREEKVRYYRAEDNEDVATEKPGREYEPKQQTEAPDMKWNAEISAEVDNAIKEHQSAEQDDQKDVKPSKLQDLVDAIGTRMKDIENVVQKMSERVQKEDVDSEEKRLPEPDDAKDADKRKLKKPNPNGEKYKRFQTKTKSSKHSRKSENAEHGAFTDDEQNGYYSDAVNSILRRNEPKEPQHATYMAPIDARRKHHKTTSSEHKDKKKHTLKKKKTKHHKKHHEHDKRRRNSVEVDRFVVSLEDSSGSNVIV